MANRNGNAPIHSLTVTPAGNSQSTATLVSRLESPAMILAAGDAVTGIQLPIASKGKLFFVKNTSSSQLGTLYVYPGVGDSINALGTNNPIALGPLTAATFGTDSSRTWHTVPVTPA